MILIDLQKELTNPKKMYSTIGLALLNTATIHDLWYTDVSGGDVCVYVVI